MVGRGVALVGVMMAVFSIGACVSDEPDVFVGDQDGTTSDTDGSNGGDGSSDVDSGVASLTVAADQDPTPGNVHETLTVHRAANEGTINAYNVYWAAGSTKGASVATLPKTGGDLTTDAVGAVPAGATQFLLFTSNTDGTETQVASAAVRDNFPVYIDVSAPTDASSAGSPSIAIDGAGGNMFVTSRNGYLRCTLGDLTGASCGIVPIQSDAGGLVSPGAIAVDETTGLLVFPVANSRASAGNAEGVWTCKTTDKSGATCVFTNTTFPATTTTDQDVSAVIAPGGTLYEISQLRPSSGGDVVDSAMCTLASSGSATSCMHTQGPTGSSPLAVYDPSSSSVVFSYQDATSKPHIGHFTPAYATDVTLSTTALNGSASAIGLDDVNHKVVVVGENQSAGLTLFTCGTGDATGASKTSKDITTGQSNMTDPSLAIDSVNKKVWVAFNNGGNSAKLGLLRCDLDGSNCAVIDATVGEGVNSGTTPSIAIDAAGQRLYVAVNNGARGNRDGVYSLGLW